MLNRLATLAAVCLLAPVALAPLAAADRAADHRTSSWDRSGWSDGYGVNAQVTGCRTGPAAWLYKSVAALIAALMVL